MMIFSQSSLISSVFHKKKKKLKMKAKCFILGLCYIFNAKKEEMEEGLRLDSKLEKPELIHTHYTLLSNDDLHFF